MKMEKKMDIKEYLKQVYYLDKEINFKEKELKNLENKVGYKSPIMREVKSTAMKTEQDLICDIADYKESIRKEISKLIAIRQNIVDIINDISDIKVRTILYLRYLEFKKWFEIANIMDYSDRQVYYLHNIGLKYLENILNMNNIAQ